MLGFILSKINLLILVVAIFAIVAFFTFGLIDLVRINEARILLDRVSQKSFSITSSASYCFSDSFDLPPRIRVGGEDLYYVLKVSKQTIKASSPSEKDITVVIFSMHDRVDYVKYVKDGRTGKEPPSISASSFRTPAVVSLYSRDYKGDKYESANARLNLTGSGVSDVDQEQEIIVDPNSIDKYNTVEFLKEIRDGEPLVYIYACSSVTTASACDLEKKKVESKACSDYAGPSSVGAGNALGSGGSRPTPASCPAPDGSTPGGGAGVWFNC